MKSQLIRFKRLSSTIEDFNQTCKTLFSYIQRRGYSSSKFRKLKYEIWYKYDATLKPQQAGDKTIPLIMNYSSLGTQLLSKYRNILKKNDLFLNYKIVSAYRIPKNLRGLLVRADFTNCTTKPTSKGAFITCGGRHCNVCKFSADCTHFESHHTSRVYPIENNLNCKSDNVIYLIWCLKCKVQYVGETSKSLQERFSAHVSCIRTKKQTAIAIHFNGTDHSLLDLKIIAICKIESQKERKTREKQLIVSIQTYYPKGLNYFPIDKC